jgi:CRISPR-associated protein Csd1
MILQALANYYEVLVSDEDSGVSPPGSSSAKVSFAAIISQQGELVDLEDLRIQSGNKMIARGMIVPEQIKKTSGIASNFLCENASYSFGLATKGDVEKSKKQFLAFKNFHLQILNAVFSKDVDAFKLFLNNWNYDEVLSSKVLERNSEYLLTCNLVFKIDGSSRYLHQLTEVRNAWKAYKAGSLSEEIGQCLISGEMSPIARLHPSIKGVVGSQAMGASIVSFTPSAFCSYGKEQSYNAPVSEESTFAYTTALNYLLSSDKHRIRVGDTTAVFWAEKSTDGLEESIFKELFDPVSEAQDDETKEFKGRVPDEGAVRRIKMLLNRLKEGLTVDDPNDDFNRDTQFYILGLSPNAARLSIRFWYQDTFIKLVEKMLQHQLDMDIVRPKNANDMVTPWRILKEAAARQDTKNISPLLAGNLARSILSGQVYGESIYTHMISRIRADGKVSDIRAGMIKACSMRKHRKQGNLEKEAMYTVSLNTENSNTGYRLGRLFAVMEKAQQDASPGLNATIKDRYFGAASTTPGSVFPILVKLSQHHISKAEYGRFRDTEMQGILETVESFPSYMNLEDQGQFILGYYHQKQSFYVKRNIE